MQSMPIVGFGTWKATDSKSLKSAIKTAISTGYRHIDCAPVYQNEKIVGEALKEIYSEGKVKREDLWITSKLWNTCHRLDNVRECCLQTIEDLQANYLDLYLIHWPHAFEDTDQPRNRDPKVLFPTNEDGTMRYSNTSFLETWKAMEELVDEGLVRHIGLSNFNQQQILRVLNFAIVRPMVLQCESNPRFSNKELFWFALSQGMICTSYCPLASGNTDLLNHPIITELAEKYRKTSAQIVLRWQIDRGNTVIPKSVTPSRIAENFDIQTWKLKTPDVLKLYTLETGKRCVGLERDQDHPDYPFKN